MPVLDTVSRLAELSVDAARKAGSVALPIARRLAARILGDRPGGDDASGWTRRWEPSSSRPVGEPPPPPSEPRRPAAAAPAPRRPAPPPAPAPATRTPAPPEPAHVDRGADVVAESADAGAADGAGAEVRVDEPWDGYSRLTARDVTAQLATANAATLAVVRLYESSHRNRRTVLAAVDRRLATRDS
jgi:hypothetical protein